MRLTVERIDGTNYLDLVMTQKEYDRLQKKGICNEFTGTLLEDQFLNIFIRKEGCEKFYAVEEGQVKQSSFRERKRTNGYWTTTETGCGNSAQDSWKIQKTEKEIIDELSTCLPIPKKRGRPFGSRSKSNSKSSTNCRAKNR